MQRRQHKMNKSDSIKELATALNKAQAEMSKAHKKSTNPHFGSSYANLSEVLTCVKDAFSSNGISFAQLPTFDNGIVCVETVLMHDSGEWISSVSGSPIVKQTPQGVGDAITYLRRYSLAAMAGLAQEDDDGNSHSSSGGNKTPVIDDNKEWYTDDLFEQHSSYIIKQKGDGVSSENIIKNMRNTWKVAKKYQQRVEDLK
jgi:hypothetical protein